MKRDEIPADPRALCDSGPVLLRGYSSRAAVCPEAETRKPGALFLLFGVIMPMVAIIFETQTHSCARAFFDPLPSNMHVALASLVPLAGALIWLAVRLDLSAFYCPINLLAGMAMGISVMYSIMFVPTTPSALGGGLLVLSPFLAILCFWKGEDALARVTTAAGTFFDARQVQHLGHLIILMSVLVIEFQSTITRVYMQVAAKPQTSVQGIRFLRKYGSEDVMLRACYEHSGRATDILGTLAELSHPLKVEQARDIFYRVTGKPFNTVPVPGALRATMRHAGIQYGSANAGVDDEFDLDTDVAGETVSGFARGLSVRDSVIEGAVHADDAVAQLTWTISFQNKSKYDREARAKILLPPDAVVTDARVWVYGKELEARIEPRGKARSEYRAAVEEKSGPLLVSVCGPNRILLQCYPVPAHDQLTVELKIKTLLTLDRDKQGVLALPSFVEKNFRADASHRVRISSSKPVNFGSSCKPVTVGCGANLSSVNGKYVLESSIKSSELYSSDYLIRVTRSDRYSGRSVLDPFERGSGVQETIAEGSTAVPARLTVLVDGSVSMAPFMGQVRESLRRLSAPFPVEILFVSDDLQSLCGTGTRTGSGEFRHALEQLTSDRCGGGQDNITVLEDVLLKHLSQGQAVLWIHGPQPQNSTSGRLSSILLDYPNAAQVYDLQLAPGPDTGLDGVYRSHHMNTVKRVGTCSETLDFFFECLCGRVKPSVVNLSKLLLDYQPGGYSVVAASAYQSGEDELAARALAQLCAYNDVLDAHAGGFGGGGSPLEGLACRHHIVSPESSAVVTVELLHQEVLCFVDRASRCAGEKSIAQLRAKINYVLGGPKSAQKDSLSKRDDRSGAPLTSRDGLVYREAGRPMPPPPTGPARGGAAYEYEERSDKPAPPELDISSNAPGSGGYAGLPEGVASGYSATGPVPSCAPAKAKGRGELKAAGGGIPRSSALNEFGVTDDGSRSTQVFDARSYAGPEPVPSSTFPAKSSLTSSAPCPPASPAPSDASEGEPGASAPVAVAESTRDESAPPVVAGATTDSAALSSSVSQPEQLMRFLLMCLTVIAVFTLLLADRMKERKL